MAFGARHSRALVLGASAFSFALMSSGAAFTQTAGRGGRHARVRAEAEASEAQARQAAAAAAAPQRRCMNAMAQIGGAPVQSLDTITVVATRRPRSARSTRWRRSASVTLEQIQGLQPNRLSDIFYNMPGVSVQERGDDPATVDQHPRPAGFRPRRRRRRRRAAELSAHRPQRQRLVLPRSRTGRRRRCRARPDRQYLRLRRDRRRGLVPHQGHQRRRAPRRALGCRS